MVEVRSRSGPHRVDTGWTPLQATTTVRYGSCKSVFAFDHAFRNACCLPLSSPRQAAEGHNKGFGWADSQRESCPTLCAGSCQCSCSRSCSRRRWKRPAGVRRSRDGSGVPAPSARKDLGMPSGVGVSRTQPISNLAVAVRNPDPTLKTAARTPMGSSYGGEVYLYVQKPGFNPLQAPSPCACYFVRVGCFDSRIIEY